MQVERSTKMRSGIKRAMLGVVALAAMCGQAQAQTVPSKPFATVGGLAEWGRYRGASPGAASAFGAGIFLSESWSVQGEVELATRATRSDTSPFVGCYSTPCQPTQYRYDSTEKWTVVSVVFAAHTRPLGRVRPAFLLGPGFVWRQRTYSLSSAVGNGPWTNLVADPPRSFQDTAVIIGGQAEIDLTRRVAIVPQVRVFLVPYYDGIDVPAVRAGVSVRARF
jgi:hypothetical protein